MPQSNHDSSYNNRIWHQTRGRTAAKITAAKNYCNYTTKTQTHIFFDMYFMYQRGYTGTEMKKNLKNLKLKKNILYEGSFLQKNNLNILSVGVHRNDNRKVKLKIKKIYERLFSHKIILNIVSIGDHRNDLNKRTFY